MQHITINGITVKFDGKKLTVEGFEPSEQDVVISNDKVIKGDVTGNVEIRGNNITVVIEGDVTGNITGSGILQVEGDVCGNVVGSWRKD